MEDMGSEWDLYHLFRAKGEKMVYEMCYQGKSKDCIRYPTAAVPKTEL